MKILHINNSDDGGGAAKASYRIHESLMRVGANSTLAVNVKNTDDINVIGPKSRADKFKNLIRAHALHPVKNLLQTENKILHSLNILNSKWPKFINNSDYDIVNLHWINSEMLSIYDISKIQKPIVWTLHDMWPFCGAEHVTYDSRWINGYSSKNRPEYESGLDINKFIWSLKKIYWKKPIQIVTPSSWIHDCARSSSLMRQWPIKIIPNPIDLDFWRVMNREESKKVFNIPKDKFILMYGAIGGTRDYHKGYDLLVKSLEMNTIINSNIELIILGQSNGNYKNINGCNIKYIKHLHDDISMMLLLNSIDAVVIPSRIDNFPNIALEAQSCGVPIIGFESGGLKDIIRHRENGFLANPYSPEDLLNGIMWAYSQKNIDKEIIRNKSRENAFIRYGYENIGRQYLDLYKNLL
jgi:glycosyltransferase involved in cell wall biosynthesis